MKPILALFSWSVLAAAALRGEEAPKVAWQEMTPKNLRIHLEQAQNFRDIKKLLGDPTSTSNNGISSTAHYKFRGAYTLVFSGNSRNDFDKNDDLRLVRSVFLFHEVDDDLKVVWQIIKKIEGDDKFRSYHIDLPTTRMKKHNKAEMATPRKPSD